MLRLENITGGYDRNNPILKGISLEVKENEVVAIIGQNGAGKSTLVKAILNMLPYTEGDILFEGKLLKGKTTVEIVNSGVGFFLQGGRVFPHLTVEENIVFAGIGLSKKEFEKRKKEVVSYFDLFKNNENGRLNLKASYLSGGEQHQLALAMVLMKGPKILILDEPSAGLSPGNVKNLYRILDDIRVQQKIRFLLIEQNVKMAFEFSDRGLLLINGLIEEENLEFKAIEEKYFK